MEFLMSVITLKGIGSYAPPKILNNQDFEKIIDTSDEWIVTRSGIHFRHIALPDQATSDLAFEASKVALEQAQLDPKDLDLIIVGTSSPDMFFPSTACLLAEKLSAPNPMAFDVQAGCSGFLYALSTAEQFLRNGTYRNALVLGADTITRFTDYTDRSTCFLFGDGAGAFVLEKQEKGEEFILDFLNGTDPTGTGKLLMHAGGSKRPACTESIQAHEHFLKMNGKEIFKFAVRISEVLINELLKRNHLKSSDIAWYAFHQANIRIIEAASERLNITVDQTMLTIDHFGNTSSATVPMSMHEYAKKGKLKKGDLVIMVVFGAGLTYSAALVRWPL
jgi:3-oxoacyl-[acyl-carrier-protein] synthase III